MKRFILSMILDGESKVTRLDVAQVLLQVVKLAKNTDRREGAIRDFKGDLVGIWVFDDGPAEKPEGAA